jgi:hypothetical protein
MTTEKTEPDDPEQRLPMDDDPELMLSLAYRQLMSPHWPPYTEEQKNKILAGLFVERHEYDAYVRRQQELVDQARIEAQRQEIEEQKRRVSARSGEFTIRSREFMVKRTKAYVATVLFLAVLLSGAWLDTQNGWLQVLLLVCGVPLSMWFVVVIVDYGEAQKRREQGPDARS